MELNSKLLDKKVIIITGANRGIGKKILETFAQNGAIIYAISRNQDHFGDYCELLRIQYGTEIYPVFMDINDKDSLRDLFLRISKESKKLDCVINNAGVMIDSLIGMINKDLVDLTFNTNVFSVINMIQYATKFMKKQNYGSIINLSSIMATNGNTGQLVYSASKGAINAITLTASKELAKYNIRVNAISPGIIDTDMFRSIGSKLMEEKVKKISMGRVGTTNDVSDLAMFLASDSSRYITGQIIGIDGGLII